MSVVYSLAVYPAQVIQDFQLFDGLVELVGFEIEFAQVYVCTLVPGFCPERAFIASQRT